MEIPRLDRMCHFCSPSPRVRAVGRSIATILLIGAILGAIGGISYGMYCLSVKVNTVPTIIIAALFAITIVGAVSYFSP